MCQIWWHEVGNDVNEPQLTSAIYQLPITDMPKSCLKIHSLLQSICFPIILLTFILKDHQICSHS